MKHRKKRLKTVGRKKLPDLKPWLDTIASRIETPSYIDHDPVCFMHAFQDKNDREVAGFLAAMMAWGRRDIVISKVDELLRRMDYRPAEFALNYAFEPSGSRNSPFKNFKHRTFTADDVHWLVERTGRVLHSYGSLEGLWRESHRIAGSAGPEMMTAFHDLFFGDDFPGPARVRKHVATGAKKSSCKRLWLYLRWCVRKGSVVDPGTMTFIDPSRLMIPLDVHVARYARILGLLSRHANDWLAVEELTERLRLLDPADPARYDYALFGVGISGESIPAGFILNPWYK
jgi:uncharacterized protein (TIGR02757 family)